MEETLTGNSYKSKIQQKNASELKEEKKIDKVVTGNVKKKRSSKFLSSIFATEDAGKVKSYVVLDVLIPAFKKAIYDVITSGIEILLYGESGRRSKSGASKISYASYYDGGSSMRTREPSARYSSYGYEDYVIDNRGEAEEVLSKMEELVDVYGMASIADYYELIGVTGNFTDNKYGWKDLRTAQIVRAYNGYLIKFPKAEPLN